jgi:hypothetical protein
MQYVGDINIPDSRINISFPNVNWQSGTLLIPKLISDNSIEFKNCKNINIAYGQSNNSFNLSIKCNSIDNSTETGTDAIIYKPSNTKCYIIADIELLNPQPTIPIVDTVGDTVLFNCKIIKSNYDSSKQFLFNNESTISILSGGQDNG